MSRKLETDVLPVGGGGEVGRGGGQTALEALRQALQGPGGVAGRPLRVPISGEQPPTRGVQWGLGNR